MSVELYYNPSSQDHLHPGILEFSLGKRCKIHSSNQNSLHRYAFFCCALSLKRRAVYSRSTILYNKLHQMLDRHRGYAKRLTLSFSAPWRVARSVS